ncbi:MAG: hypothetical protein K9N09_11585 [Candidatus Cloacimonetes bacterium]|nr:hypothetical protein [Candidatus Cloacimonadota bacterium]MCF7814982.1 hypothetical protein [Candidatus Cloacimonadota bacterium]MCF7869326.1 hypothetical protein [Candidatus Cloacimonadota bacterium]MCF7884301.1 hypothetical protein [Candidatus Cloacimonadota bacterium]
MIVKHLNFNSSVLTIFDLVGDDETALTKALAFIFSKDRNVLFKFLRAIGIRISNTENNFKNTLIQIENKRDEGRTDLEISNANIFHLIIEAKVRKNKVTKQQSQYLTAFDDKCKQNVFCILSHYRDSNIELNENVRIINLSWIDIINILDCKDFQDNKLLMDFMRYAMKKYKLNEQKEILVQDLSKESEIKRFKEYHVYRRDVTYGTPLYFAPYFTRKALQEEGEGISYLSKVVGVLTLSPTDVDKFRDDITAVQLKTV